MPEVTILNQTQELEHTIAADELNEAATVVTALALRNINSIVRLTIGEKRISLTAFTFAVANQRGVLTLTDGSNFKEGSILFITYR